MEFERTRFYRVAAVAEHFDVHRSTIYRAIESGALDAVRIGAGQGALRVRGSAVAAYLETRSGSAETAGQTDQPADAAVVVAGEVA